MQDGGENPVLGVVKKRMTINIVNHVRQHYVDRLIILQITPTKISIN